MRCQDTGEIPVCDLHNWIHVDMTVAEAQELSAVVPAVRVLKGFGNGEGEICIPFLNGLIDKIRITLTDYRARGKRRHQQKNER